MIYCNYVVPEYRRPMLGGFVNQSPEGMRHRINKLEGLVLSLVADGSSQAEPGALCAPTASTQSRQSSTASGLSFGIVSSTTMRQCQDDNQESEAQRMFQHVGTTDVYGGCAVHPSDGHWYAILMEIMDVKNCLSTHQQEYSCRFVDGENLRDNMMGAVEQCVKTWDRVRKQNMEAHKAYVALRVMVKKLKAYRVSQQTALSDPPQRLPPRSATSATLSNRGKYFSIKAHHGSLLEQIAAVVPEIPSSGDKSPNPTFSLASRLGFTAAPQIAGGAHPMLEDTLTDMDGMLHDLMKGERTDLTLQSWDLETSTGESNGSSSSSSQTSDLVEAIGGGIENLVADIDEVSMSFLSSTSNVIHLLVVLADGEMPGRLELLHPKCRHHGSGPTILAVPFG